MTNFGPKNRGRGRLQIPCNTPWHVPTNTPENALTRHRDFAIWRKNKDISVYPDSSHKQSGNFFPLSTSHVTGKYLHRQSIILHAEISSQIRLYDQVGISLCLDMGTSLHRRSFTLCAEISPHPEYITVCSLWTGVRIFPHFRTMSLYVEISAHSVWVRYHMKKSLHIQSVNACKDISPFPDKVTVCRNLRTFSLWCKDISPYPDYVTIRGNLLISGTSLDIGKYLHRRSFTFYAEISPYPDYVTVCGNLPISGTSLDIGKYLHRRSIILCAEISPYSDYVTVCGNLPISGTSLGNICTEDLSPCVRRFLHIHMSPYVEISA